MTDGAAVARRFALDPALVEELLLDFQAFGRVERVGFADLTGWSLTAAGRHEDERLLATELDETGTRADVTQAYEAFRTLNGRLLTLITKWQLRPTLRDELAANDHSDWAWDEDVLKGLARVGRLLEPQGAQLAKALARFDGYPARFTAALDRVDQGDRRWVDQTKIDSCHTVWFELHEDLLATLGIDRGTAA